MDGRLAVDDLLFDLHAGEVVALLGPNGAGKTTSIRILLGLSGITFGEVRLFGHRAGSRTARERTGAVLQVGEASVPENLRIEEHIDLFRSDYPHPLPMSEILEITGLKGIEKRRFGKLSGGEQQRLLFALAICGNPDLLFLDEPTVGMDVETRRSMWQQIRRFAASGKTILLTTHYLEEADALADRIVVLNRGKKIAEGTPAKIKAISGKRAISCKTILTVERLRRLEAVVSVSANGHRTLIATSAPEATIRELMALDPELTDLELTTAALEDAFVLLTARGECAVVAAPGDSV